MWAPPPPSRAQQSQFNGALDKSPISASACEMESHTPSLGTLNGLDGRDGVTRAAVANIANVFMLSVIKKDHENCNPPPSPLPPPPLLLLCVLSGIKCQSYALNRDPLATPCDHKNIRCSESSPGPPSSTFTFPARRRYSVLSCAPALQLYPD